MIDDDGIPNGTGTTMRKNRGGGREGEGGGWSKHNVDEDRVIKKKLLKNPKNNDKEHGVVKLKNKKRKSESKVELMDLLVKD